MKEKTKNKFRPRVCLSLNFFSTIEVCFGFLEIGIKKNKTKL
jgi:hypothetical protein